MRTIENRVKFVNQMSDEIINEALRTESNPYNVLKVLHDAVKNKITAMQKTNDSVDAIRYAMENPGFIDHANCRCEVQMDCARPSTEPTPFEARCIEQLKAISDAMRSHTITIPAGTFKQFSLGQWGLTPKSIIYNNRTTIVIWSDDTKTIVRCADGQEFDEYTGFVAAIAKKMYGSTPKVKKLIDEIKVVQPTKQKKQKQEPDAVADTEETAPDEQQISLEELEDDLLGSQQNSDNASSNA